MDNVTFESIREASARGGQYLHRTPVMTSEYFDGVTGRHLFFKLESLQKTGAFKARGALNAVLLLPDDVRHVVTHSSGNHAAALAWAGAKRGKEAHIVMPSNAPPVKVQAVKGYGAQVHLCEPNLAARESTAKQLVEELGAAFVHPSDDPVVIAGQGTVGLELVEQVKEQWGVDLDAVIVPVGGGGLIAGVATAVKALLPNALVIGAEPEAAADAARSKEKGELCGHPAPPRSIADGLLTMLGRHTWPVVRDSVDMIVTVPERDIARGVRTVYERMKLVIEPSAGVGVAVALGALKGLPPRVRKVGVILCGGNIDLERLPDVLALASEEAKSTA